MYKKRKMQKQKCTVNLGFLELRASKWCFAFLQEETVIEIQMDEVRLPPSCRKLSPPKQCFHTSFFQNSKEKEVTFYLVSGKVCSALISDSHGSEKSKSNDLVTSQ